MNLTICYMIMFFSHSISLCWNHKHNMMSLLSLELITLSLFCCFTLVLSFTTSDFYMYMLLIS